MKSILFVGLLFFSFASIKSQYTITNFNTSNSGLTNDRVWSVTFDRDNTAWFGINNYPAGTGGIAIYDGVSWEIIKLDEDSLYPAYNNVTKVLFAPNQDKWICSYGGSFYASRVTKMDSTGFVDVTPPLFGLSVKGFTNHHSIWFIDWWNGLFEYNYDSLKWILHNNFPVEVPDNPITAFNIDSSGMSWIGIANRNIFLYKDTVLDTINLFPIYPPEYKFYYYVKDIAFDKDHTSWFGTNAGLIHWFGKDQFTTYNILNSEIQSNDIAVVRIDTKGRIWSGSSFQGLSVFDGNNFTVFDTSNALIGNNEIRDIEEDKEGNIWVATWGAGVYKFTYDPSAVNELPDSPKAFEIYPNPVKASGEFTIRKKSSTEIKSFHLCSLDGKVLRQYDVIDKDNFITIRELGVLPGFYMGMITDTKGNQSAVKIMVVD